MTKTRVGTVVVGIAIALVLVVYLRQRSEKAKFPIVYNVANLLDAGALKQIEELVRTKGEPNLISIAVVNAKSAIVTAGDGGFEPTSGRIYKVRRAMPGWEIDEVESWKNEH